MRFNDAQADDRVEITAPKSGKGDIMKRIVLSVIMALVGFCFFSGSGLAAEPIKFGFLHSLSGGVGQVYGIPDLEGVKIAVDEINASGGVLGRPLEVISRDDKLSPETGVREPGSNRFSIPLYGRSCRTN